MAGDKQSLQDIFAKTTVSSIAAIVDKSYASALANTILGIVRANQNVSYNLQVKLVEKYIEVKAQQAYVDKAASYRKEFYDCFVVFWEDENPAFNKPPGMSNSKETISIPNDLSIRCIRCRVKFSVANYGLDNLIYQSRENHKRICGQGHATGPGHIYYSCRGKGDHDQWISKCSVRNNRNWPCRDPYGYWRCLPHIHSFAVEGDKHSTSPSGSGSSTCTLCSGTGCSACQSGGQTTNPSVNPNGNGGTPFFNGDSSTNPPSNGGCTTTLVRCKKYYSTYHGQRCYTKVSSAYEHRTTCPGCSVQYWTCNSASANDDKEKHRLRTCYRSACRQQWRRCEYPPEVLSPYGIYYTTSPRCQWRRYTSHATIYCSE